MTALSSLEYPHWLIMAGAVLLMLGCIGLAFSQRGADAEPLADVSDEGHYAPEAELNEIELYNRTAKEKRRERWVETAADEEPIEAEATIRGTK